MHFSECLFNVEHYANNTTVVCNNLTFESQSVWTSPNAVKITSIIILTGNILASLVLNSLLFLVLQHSPSLKTPPNSHLINICVNNILLCVAMVLAIISTNVSNVDSDNTEVAKALSGVQIFIVYNAIIQYWGTFACIGYYRQKTIRDPAMTLRMRRLLVSRSISGNWVVSLFLSLACCLTHSSSVMTLQLTLDPFRVDYLTSKNAHFTVEQLIVVLLILFVFVTGFVTIFASYYNIFKTLNLTGTFGKNRVTPWQRTASLVSDVADLTVPSGRSYGPCDNSNGRPFTVSQKANDTLVVHFQKCDHSLILEDIIALENPIQASRNTKQLGHRQVQVTLSNGSTQTRCPEFTDISMGAELERCQRLKNYSALQNQYFRRDRGSLSSATRNSLVMFSAYLVCSFPLIICSIPRALHSIPPSNRVIALLVCRLLFFLNAPVYPAWYLLFSKRVRKCLRRMMDVLLLHLNIRA